jgi:enoyl-CoA hydratase/carnithine racemase
MAAANEDEPIPHVRVEQVEAVAVATLVNPSRRNAISLGMWRELEAFAVNVSADTMIRAVVICGEGGVFSAGADIAGFEGDRPGRGGPRSYDDQLERSCLAVEAIRQPTVARLEGPVIGAGAALAASCDLRVAATDAFFMVPAARLGLGYDPRGVARLVRAFGEAPTRWMLMTAGRMPVERAFAQGAVHEVVPQEKLDDAVARLVMRLAENAPLTLAAAKVAVRAVTAGGETTLMEEAWRLSDLADASTDYLEGRAAFAEKRPPEFTGS